MNMQPSYPKNDMRPFQNAESTLDRALKNHDMQLHLPKVADSRFPLGHLGRRGHGVGDTWQVG